jgi:DNA-binding LacI/PurR family transcriptional regulator
VISRPTLASLAEQLGVSRQTVSNAINAPERVKPVTLQRVAALIASSGYRPNAAARQLRTGRSRNLGFRLFESSDGINGSIMDRFLHTLTERLQRHGYRITLFAAASDDAEIESYEELLETSDLDGFVLTGTHRNDARTRWLLDREIPFVAFGRPWSADDEACPHPWVDVDSRRGTADATTYLLGKGHSRIGFLGWREDTAFSDLGRERYEGWLASLESHLDAAELQKLSVRVPDTVPDGAAGAGLLLANGATSIVCASDSLALGALLHLRASDSDRVPEVIGFDDTPVAAALGLSSISQPVEEVAEKIVDVMRAVLDGPMEPAARPSHLLLAPKLVLRDGGWRQAEPTGML